MPPTRTYHNFNKLHFQFFSLTLQKAKIRYSKKNIQQKKIYITENKNIQ